MPVPIADASCEARQENLTLRVGDTEVYPHPDSQSKVLYVITVEASSIEKEVVIHEFSIGK